MMIFLILAAFLLLILLAALYPYRTAFYSPKGKHATADAPLQGEQYEQLSEHIYRMSHIMAKIPFEHVVIESFDGLKLSGRYYHVQDGAPIEILFHGYRSHAFRDCSGGHALSRKMGFNALVVDQRSHGESEGKTITFGIKERYDCLAWANYVSNRFGKDTPIILSGLSMGAATVLMAADLNLPKNVACIIADSPYSTPGAIIEKVCEDLHYPVALCRPFIHLAAFVYGRFRLNGCTAKEAVQQALVPILLIHGEEDRLVPCSMSKEIAQVCSCPVAVHTFSGAGHGLSYMVDPVRYEKVVYEFLTSIPSLKDSIWDQFIRRWEQ